MRTRSQEFLALAEELVTQVEGYDQRLPDTGKTYGGLCHAFPVLVRTCGLCQALAFCLDKATVPADKQKEPKHQAHELLLLHVGQVLGVNDAAADPAGRIQAVVAAVRDASTEEYMLHTRRVLDAWVYFKRFAVSILKVEFAEEARDGS